MNWQDINDRAFRIVTEATKPPIPDIKQCPKCGDQHDWSQCCAEGCPMQPAPNQGNSK